MGLINWVREETIVEGNAFIVYTIDKEYTEMRVRSFHNRTNFLKIKKVSKGDSFEEDLYEYRIRNAHGGLVTYNKISEILLFAWMRFFRQDGTSIKITVLDALAYGQAIELLKMLKVTDGTTEVLSKWGDLGSEVGATIPNLLGTTLNYFVLHGYEEIGTKRRTNFLGIRKFSESPEGYSRYHFYSYSPVEVLIEDKADDIFGGMFKKYILDKFVE